MIRCLAKAFLNAVCLLLALLLAALSAFGRIPVLSTLGLRFAPGLLACLAIISVSAITGLR